MKFGAFSTYSVHVGLLNSIVALVIFEQWSNTGHSPPVEYKSIQNNIESRT